MSDEVKAAAERLLEQHTQGLHIRRATDGYPMCDEDETPSPCDTVIVSRYVLADHNEAAALRERVRALEAALREHRTVMFAMLTPMMDGSERLRAKELLARPALASAETAPGEG